jgi:hypothetical protein
VTLSPSSPQPTSTAGGQPNASPQVEQATGLHESSQAALKSIRDDYFYWTGKLTESSFALSLAVIGANWAVFGSVDKVLNNIWAELSIAAVISSLVISLIGNGWLGRLLRQRIEYAERDTTRWQKEFSENAGKSTPWPSTQTIDCWAAVFRLAKIFLPVIGGAFFLIALFTQPKAQKDESHSRVLASAVGGHAQSPNVTGGDSAQRDTIAQGQLEEPIAKRASEETKADAEAKPTPELIEDTEEMNDRYDPSPDQVLFAATRLIPDRVYIQRHNLDALAVAIFRVGEEGLTVVARHDFPGRVITHIEWSPDSKFLLFTTSSSEGHAPWHSAPFLFCTADNSFRDVEAAIGSVASPKFRFEPPDIAIVVVNKGEMPEDDLKEVKVPLAKTMDSMPRVK